MLKYPLKGCITRFYPTRFVCLPSKREKSPTKVRDFPILIGYLATSDRRLDGTYNPISLIGRVVSVRSKFVSSCSRPPRPHEQIKTNQNR